MQSVRPVLKWVGGKAKLLPLILANLPELPDKISYVEPFCGSASVYFGLRDLISNPFRWSSVTLADKEIPLIQMYRAIQYSSGEILSYLWDYQKKYNSRNMNLKRDMYYELRGNYNTLIKYIPYISDGENYKVELGALLIFLNHTCFNGLYRTNKRGEFNVPFGSYETINIMDIDNIAAVRNALHGIIIRACDFVVTSKAVTKDTFVYLDPPYSSRWTKYDGRGFANYDFERLLNYMRICDLVGAKIMLSYDSDLREQSGGGHWSVIVTGKSCTVNPKRGGFRTEHLIMNY